MTLDKLNHLFKVLTSLAGGKGVIQSTNTKLRATLIDISVDNNSQDPRNVVWKLYLDYLPHSTYNKGRTGRAAAYIEAVKFFDEFCIVSHDLYDQIQAAHRYYDQAIRSQQTSLPYEVWLEQTVGLLQLVGENAPAVVH